MWKLGIVHVFAAVMAIICAPALGQGVEASGTYSAKEDICKGIETGARIKIGVKPGTNQDALRSQDEEHTLTGTIASCGNGVLFIKPQESGEELVSGGDGLVVGFVVGVAIVVEETVLLVGEADESAVVAASAHQIGKSFGIFEGDGSVGGSVEEDRRDDTFLDMVGGRKFFPSLLQLVETIALLGGVDYRIEKDHGVGS
jgi:hypothetical protein